MDWIKTNHVKRALREGRPTAGSWLHLCGGISAEIMSRAGFDWLLVDMEHGHGDPVPDPVSDTALLVQGAQQALGKFQEEFRS